MSSPINNDDPDSGLRTYSAVLPPGLRLNPRSGVVSGTVVLGKPADTTLADERPSAPEDEVKPDLLIDPPTPKPDDPQQPPNNPDP